MVKTDSLTLSLTLALILFNPGNQAQAATMGSELLEHTQSLKTSLIPYRAVYDVKMTSSKRGSEILGVSGNAVISFQHSCFGWTTDQRYRMIYEYSAANPVEMTTQVSSFEKFDGQVMDFSNVRFHDNEILNVVRGAASLEKNSGEKNSGEKNSGGFAQFSLPKLQKIRLDSDTFFPTAHTQYLIDEAKAGKKIIFAKIFDGSDTQGVFEANAVVTKSLKAAPLSPHLSPQLSPPPSKLTNGLDSKSKIDPDLLNSAGWVIDMAVFPPQSVDELSDYELSMELQENGIVRSIRVDYHDFSIKQTLVLLQKLPKDTCEE